MQSNAAYSAPGPLGRTAIELERLVRLGAFRRERRRVSRMMLHEADALMDLVEQCRVEDFRLVPLRLWTPVVRLIGTVDAALRTRLGINRHPAHVVDVLFQAQDLLMARSIEERRPFKADIIPLFPSPETSSAGAATSAG